MPIRRLKSLSLLVSLFSCLALAGPANAAIATQLAPAAAPHGAHVVVAGAGLDAPGLMLTFTASGNSSATAAIVSRTPPTIEAEVPSSAVSGPVTLTSGNSSIATFSFTLVTDPVFVQVSTLAGRPNGDDDQHDADNGKAVFRQPLAIALTPAGDLFVADSKDNEVRRVTPRGVVTVYAGTGKSGYKDGPAAAAMFKAPAGVAFDPLRNILYVADTGNRSIRAIASDGTVSTFPGAGQDRSLSEPTGIALDPAGNLYVADRGRNVIILITPAGAMSTLAGGNGEDGLRDGPAAQARFKQPVALAVTANGIVYVADTGNDLIRKIDLPDSGGVRQVSTAAGSSKGGDHDDAGGGKNGFKQPGGIAIDASGNLLVADTGNNRIRMVSLGMPSAVVTTIAGGAKNGFVDGTLLGSAFNQPAGLAVAGAIYVADAMNDAVRIISSPVAATDLWPRRGPLTGGTVIRIFGTGFTAGTTDVKFGGVSATNITVIADTELAVTSPAATAGPADLTVTTPVGTFILAGRYIYTPPPALVSVVPNKGVLAGGTAITISGANFIGGDTSVTIGGAGAPIVSMTDTTISVIAPSGNAGVADLVVQTPGGVVILTGGYSFLGIPTITAFTPTSGGSGTPVTIQGTNFDVDPGATVVKFGTATAAISSIASTQIVVSVPAAATSAPITIGTAGGSVQTAVTFATRTVIRTDITPVTASLVLDETKAFVATAAYSDGAVEDVTAVATWISSNALIASVNAAGVVTGRSAGTVAISATFSGALGNATVQVSQAATGPLPDPATLATPIDPTVATSLFESTKFLYTGSPLIQTGLSEATIDRKRVAIIRGNVHDRADVPLQDVSIATVGAPLYGRTRSRADGAFDYVVNGGVAVTLRYEKTGYLPVERSVDTKWNDYTLADPVVLIPQDSAVTAVDLSAASSATVRATLVADADGTRTATLVFKSGTFATMTMPDGTTQPLPVLHVRATEYTLGPEGPNTMPATLPPTSGYTYCVELSADEAVAAGASGITFTKPVAFYVENFLNFPVGSIVPTGFYDRTASRWSAVENGRVIRIQGVELGLAYIDTDGDGVADDQATLQALGIDDAERAELARIYPSGQTLWRVPIAHFSTYDCNWPYGPPTGARAPNGGAPNGGSPLDNATCSVGSIIECENQTIGESVGITGTPFTLNYRSDRVPGRKSNNVLRIPITNANVPEGTTGIRLQIAVAGRQFNATFAPAPNLSYTFTWDGLDVYGRRLEGMQPVTIRVGNVYTAQYQTPAELQKSFGATTGVPISLNRAGQEIVLWQEFRTALGSWSASSRQFGGWSLSIHHSYDPSSRTLYLGDGARRNSVGNPQNIIAQFASGLLSPTSITSDGAGNIYVADPGTATGEGRIVRISPDKTLTVLMSSINPSQVTATDDGILYIRDIDPVRLTSRVARLDQSTGHLTNVVNGPPSGAGFPEEGGQASDAGFNAGDIATGPAGDLFVTAPGGGGDTAVWHIDKDGILHKVAGCSSCDAGLNVNDRPATSIAFDSSLKIAAAKSGDVYTLEPNLRVVRRISSDGRIYQVAGTDPGGVGSSTGDGGLATAADFGGRPKSLAVGPDGSVYIGESQSRIRRITPDGIINTEAGGEACAGNSAPAKLTCADASDMTLDPQGILYMLSTDVKDMEPAMPGISKAELQIASSDGSELYVFDLTGRHKRTVNAHTNAVLYQFTYNAAGLLSGIQDPNGRTTSIERDLSGAPLAIVAPNGQRTTLGAGDWLQSVTNPVGDTFHFGYSPDGLLTSFTNPRNQTSIITYDGMGLLQRDADAAGGSTTASRTDTPTGFIASKTSEMGRTTTFTVDSLPKGDRSRVTVDPSGLRATITESAESSVTSIAADGTKTVVNSGGDPRWGMEAPVLAKVESTLPSGTKRLLTLERTVSLGDSNDPHSLISETTKITLNGRLSTSVYDASAFRTTLTTAANRQFVWTSDSLGRLVSQSVTGLLPTSRAFDSLGRVRSVSTGPSTVIFSYDALDRVTAVTDALSRTARFEYDDAGRLTRKILPDLREIAFSYDPNGNLSSVTPPTRPTHTFTFTPIDLLASDTPPPVAPATTFSYNADRQLTVVRRPDGKSINFAYDAGGRGSEVGISRGSYSFTYDPATGHSSSIADPSGGVVHFGFDGALITSTSWQGEVSGNVAWTYDSDFRVASEKVQCVSSTAAACQPVALAYDQDSLLTQAGTEVLTRNPQNGLLTATTVGAVADTVSYDGTSLPLLYEARVNAVPVFRQEFIRDAGSRITRKTETTAGTVVTYDYTYDPSGRLATITNNATLAETYQYDGNGNRIAKAAAGSTETGTFDSQDRLLSYADTTYAYSAAGELESASTASGTATYAYDELGNLLKVTLPDGRSIDYVIDGANRRVGKRINGVMVQRLLYSGDRVIAEVDSVGNVIARFVYASKVNVPDLVIKGDVVYRIVSDNLGSPRLVVNTADGTIAERLDFDAFGNVQADTSPGFQPFGFAGGLYDGDTRLVRFGARDYDARTGRWTLKDPVGFGGGDSNVYTYVVGDPINRIDPSGLSWKSTALCFAKGAVVGAAAALAIGAVAAAAVTVGAPVAAVTLGLGALAAAGVATGVWNTGSNIIDHNWDGVAYDAGAIVGGLVAGGVSGRTVARGINGEESGPFHFPDSDQNYQSGKGSLWKWFDTGPNPGSAAGAVGVAGAGAGTIGEGHCGC